MRSKPEAVKSEAALVETVEIWPIDRLVPYANNPRKNNAAVDQMCASIFDRGVPL
jgi:hypothetical protein